MALKFRLKSVDDLDPATRALYRKANDNERSFNNGKLTFEEEWVLDVEGVADKARLDEFRDSNIALQKERDAAVTERAKALDAVKAFGDLTPEAIEDLKKKAEAGGNPKVEEAVRQATEAIKADHAKQLAAKDAELAKRQDELKARDGIVHGMKIDAVFRDLAAKMHVQPSAIDDVLTRARSVYRMGDDGNLIATQGDGQKLYGKDGEPMPPAEWMEKLTESAGHLFDKSQGGGAGGGGGGGAGPMKIPAAQASKYVDEIASGKAVIED